MAYIPTFATEQTTSEIFDTVNVTSLNVFDSLRVGKIITLVGDVGYHITKRFSWGDVEFVVDPDANITFSTSNAVSNDIVTEILPGRVLFSGALSRVEFKDVNTTSLNGGTCFDFTPGNNVVPGVIISNMRMVGFDKAGTLTGITFVFENIGYVDTASGWTITDCPLMVVAEQNRVFGTGIDWKISGTTGIMFFDIILSRPLDASTMFDISGTVNLAFFNTTVSVPQSGGFVFNIDPNITITNKIQILSGLVDTSLGGAMFKPASLDQTDPRMLVENVTGTPDSQWISEIGFEGNTTVTTVSKDTPADILGTFVSGELERHTRSGGEVTYIGLEDIQESIIISASISNGTGGGKRNIQVHLLVDTGSGFSIVSTRGVSMSAETTSVSFSTEVNLSTGYKYKAQVENIENNDNILVEYITSRGKK